MKKYKLIIEKNKDGFWGQLDKQPNIFSQGQSIEELKNNMRDALELYFETINKPIPKYEFELVMDIQEFFQINNYINISTLANRMGMNASLLRQYAKGIKFPSIKQVAKIERAIKEIGKELSKIELQPN
jgi:predicted RNase H-like HicB family nuclease